jgi:hypothetical protein
VLRRQRRGAVHARLTSLALAAALLSTPSSAVAAPTAPVAGCPDFPATSWWHADVSALPADPRSATWLAHMSLDVDLHPDFGGPYGIPVTVVDRSHPRVKVRFDYAAESDRVRYPLGRDTRVEGGLRSDGDRHTVVVDRSRCRLYETWATSYAGGRWRAGSGATWDLRSNALRPDGWTSADAAGLPILPGLLRWREVRRDRIDHAIRFTVPRTSAAHLWPARHDAGTGPASELPPMGARFRLDPTYDATRLSAYAQRVVRAMQTYGLVLADNGSPWYFQGEQNRHWPTRMIEDLKTIPASAFTAVDTRTLQVDPDSGESHPVR